MKNIVIINVIWAIILALLNLILFISPLNYTKTFWIGYCFVIVNFIAAFVIFNFCNMLIGNQKLYKVYFLIIGGINVVFNIVLFVIVLNIKNIETWQEIILFSVVLSIFLIMILLILFNKNNVSSIRSVKKNE